MDEEINACLLSDCFSLHGERINAKICASWRSPTEGGRSQGTDAAAHLFCCTRADCGRWNAAEFPSRMDSDIVHDATSTNETRLLLHERTTTTLTLPRRKQLAFIRGRRLGYGRELLLLIPMLGFRQTLN